MSPHHPKILDGAFQKHFITMHFHTDTALAGRAQTGLERARTNPFPKGTTATKQAIAVPLWAFTVGVNHAVARRAPVPEKHRVADARCFMRFARLLDVWAPRCWEIKDQTETRCDNTFYPMCVFPLTGQLEPTWTKIVKHRHSAD